MQSFAIYLVPAERFNTLIGLIFIAVVVFSPDGVSELSRIILRKILAARNSVSNTTTEHIMRRAGNGITRPQTSPSHEDDASTKGENEHAQ